MLEEPQNKSVTVGSNVFQPCVCNCQLLPYWKINNTVYAINELPGGFLVNATGLLFTNVQLHHSGTMIQCQFSTFENSSFQIIHSRKGVITVHAAYGKFDYNSNLPMVMIKFIIVLLLILTVAFSSKVLSSSISKVSELIHTTLNLPAGGASSMRTSIKNGLQTQVTPTGMFILPMVTSSPLLTNSPPVTVPDGQLSHTNSITPILYQAVLPVAAGIACLKHNQALFTSLHQLFSQELCYWLECLSWCS